jgi:hypothetical protein
MNCVWLAAIGGLVLSVPAGAGEPGSKAQLVGGTVTGCAAKSSVRMDLTGSETLAVLCGKTEFRVPYRKINTLEYGQSVSRRYMEAVLISPLLLLSKARKHYVTLGYVDPQGGQQVIVLRVDKGDIRSVLAGLEARTGLRVEYQDDQARQSGKG